LEEDWTEIFSEGLSGLTHEFSIETSLVPGPAAFYHEASWATDFFAQFEGG
jgi:hypothetical protein